MSDAFNLLRENAENPFPIDPFIVVASDNICDHLEATYSPGFEAMKALATINANALVNTLAASQHKEITEEDLLKLLKAYGSLMNDHLSKVFAILPILASISNARN